MILLKLTAGGLRREEVWTRLEDDAPLPKDAPVLVSVTRWAEKPSDRAHEPGIGVWLAVGEDLPRDLPEPSVIALPFPAFNDGRAYSLARRLRRDGVTAELRAYGDVLIDQVRAMARVGFTAFEMADGTDIAAVSRALDAFPGVYQPAADDLVAAGWRRAAAVADAGGRAAE